MVIKLLGSIGFVEFIGFVGFFGFIWFVWPVSPDEGNGGWLNPVDFSSMAYEVYCNDFVREINCINNSPVPDNKFKHVMKFSFESKGTNYIKVPGEPFNLIGDPPSYSPI